MTRLFWLAIGALIGATLAILVEFGRLSSTPERSRTTFTTRKWSDPPPQPEATAEFWDEQGGYRITGRIERLDSGVQPIDPHLIERWAA